MRTNRVIVTMVKLAGLAGLAGFVAGAAQAQLVEPDSKPVLQAKPQPQDAAFAKSFKQAPQPYMKNEAEIPDVKMFGDDYRVDPKLKAGIELNQNFGIETGYSELYSRGFHYMWPGDAAERAGVLGDRGSATYLAGKITLPVDERLTTFSKVGVARSDRKLRDGATSMARDIDIGPYANVGANYKLSDKASVSGQYERFGDSARKFGNDSNAGGFSAKLKLGF